MAIGAERGVSHGGSGVLPTALGAGGSGVARQSTGGNQGGGRRHRPLPPVETRRCPGRLPVGRGRPGLLRRYAAALAEAASALGSPQIRNRATIGGNLGRSSPAADCVCALMALGAEVLVQSASGTREIPIDRFLLGPGKNALAPDELIVEVRMSKPRGRFGSRFLKLGRRKALVLATASAAAHGLVAGGDPGRGRRGRPGGLADLGRAGFGRIPADGDPRPGRAGARRRLGSGVGGLTRRAV